MTNENKPRVSKYQTPYNDMAADDCGPPNELTQAAMLEAELRARIAELEETVRQRDAKHGRIAELEAQNDRLEARMDTGYVDAQDAALQWCRTHIAELEAENKRLREVMASLKSEFMTGYSAGLHAAKDKP